MEHKCKMSEGEKSDDKNSTAAFYKSVVQKFIWHRQKKKKKTWYQPDQGKVHTLSVQRDQQQSACPVTTALNLLEQQTGCSVFQCCHMPHAH